MYNFNFNTQGQFEQIATEELTSEELMSISGGRLAHLITAFEVGWEIGTYIDQNYIKPLW